MDATRLRAILELTTCCGKIPPDWERVDLRIAMIGVNKSLAEKNRANLLQLLDDWPNESIVDCPSHKAIEAVIGDLALQLIALGQVLELWDAITPFGWVVISGYRHGSRTTAFRLD
jgi:hypothetical protein